MQIDADGFVGQVRNLPHILYAAGHTCGGWPPLFESGSKLPHSKFEHDIREGMTRSEIDAGELIDEEVVTCQQYLAIEQLRLGDRLQVVWRLDDMPGDALLPSLLLQPLVENAVHHGIEPRSEPGEVSVEIMRSGERVRVEILNPVAEGQPAKPGNQMALSNVRERLMLLYDMEAELKTSAEHGQFRLVLEFPYRKERRRRDVRRHFSPYS